jgi:uncharacterized OB-fold protein
MSNKYSHEAFASLIPDITPVNEPFWDALHRGEIHLQHCNDCQANQYPPETFCYQCGSTDLDWQRVDGEGTIYSFTVMHASRHPAFKDHVPYPVIIVQLDDGPRMVSAVLEAKGDINIGDRVKPVIHQVSDERSILMFEPV